MNVQQYVQEVSSNIIEYLIYSKDFLDIKENLPGAVETWNDINLFWQNTSWNGLNVMKSNFLFNIQMKVWKDDNISVNWLY